MSKPNIGVVKDTATNCGILMSVKRHQANELSRYTTLIDINQELISTNVNADSDLKIDSMTGCAISVDLVFRPLKIGCVTVIRVSG